MSPMSCDKNENESTETDTPKIFETSVPISAPKTFKFPNDFDANARFADNCSTAPESNRSSITYM